MKVTFELDKPIYDYMRYHGLDFEQTINKVLRLKYHLGKDETRPHSYLPIEQSVELALHTMDTDVNNPESIIELVNYIIKLYPYTNEERVMSVLGKIIKKEHRYDRFI